MRSLPINPLRRVDTRHRSVVADLIRSNVPTLQARLRNPQIEELVRRVLTRDPDPDIFLSQPEDLRLASIALYLRSIISELEQELRTDEDAFRADANLFDGLTSDRERCQFLAHRIHQQARSRRERRGDLAALKRDFGFDCLQERHQHRQHYKSACIELALHFMAGSVNLLRNHAEDAKSEAHEVLRSADLITFCLDRMITSSRWQTRLAALSAAEALSLFTGRAASPDRLVAFATDQKEHPWVRVGALRALWVGDSKQALSTARTLLLDHEASQAGFVMRALVCKELVHHPECGLALLRRRLDMGEDSEHVRLTMARTVEPCVGSWPGAIPLLTQLAADEESPATRARAARSMVGAIKTEHIGGESTGSEAVLEELTALIAARIRLESHALPLRVLCEDLDDLGRCITSQSPTPPTPPVQRAIEQLHRAAATLVVRPDCPTNVVEPAAAASESLAAALEPSRRATETELVRFIDAIPPGGRGRIRLSDLPQDPDDEHELGRTLARITRRDYGIHADIRRGMLLIRRGDRLRTRLWRILHELRHPAPNKRQGFRHTTGRAFSGKLRAPPGRLDEVTPTVVPGERVHCEREGSWGRHLPLVDDIVNLPWFSRKPVRIFSSHGVTSVRLRGSPWRRIWYRIKLIINYAKLHGLRQRSLGSDDPGVRRQYVDTLARAYGVEVRFAPHGDARPTRASVPQDVRGLFPSSALALAPPLVPFGDESWRAHLHYFFSLAGNSQDALAIFLAGILTLAFGRSYQRNRRIRADRAALPLSVGGWGTRGKSGTERLKAGLFHGLGYEVFSKTTGCEAMFIHAVPDGPANEIFVFRPYGKATIWEQGDLLELGSAMGAQVFLWECMALNPRYVEVLQRSWMRDDYATVTNAYPDHEDVQGPAGYDVAETISRFVPDESTLVTSEINFSPLFRETCRQRNTKMIQIGDHAGELIGRDLLALFPYQEHPRNVALVAELAEELGIDHDLAIVTMADHVIPDIGVLKTYPTARVLGRDLQFINGCSANERTGFLASWRRTGCADPDPDRDPESIVMTVVNNRDDRISRSEVFSRILVEDISVDRHLVIGTNIRGLRQYLHDALDEFLETIAVARPKDLGDPEARSGCFARLHSLRHRHRVPSGEWQAIQQRLAVYARGCRLHLGDLAPVEQAWRRLRDASETTHLSKVLAELERDGQLNDAMTRSVVSRETADLEDRRELIARCPREHMMVHMRRTMARQIVFWRLEQALSRLLDSGDERKLVEFEQRVREAYREVFVESIVTIDDPTTKGDEIVRRCAEVVPPGTHVKIMGTQNIKGTGLDFVYRWIALQTMTDELESFQQGDPDTRMAALERIEAFADHGMLDLGLLGNFLATHEPSNDAEAASLERIRRKVQRLQRARQGATKRKSRWRTVGKMALNGIEGWLDFGDSIVRRRQSRRIMNDLVHRRISHPRAAVAMRAICGREKGGWLAKKLLT